jgi:hypothetical protein
MLKTYAKFREYVDDENSFPHILKFKNKHSKEYESLLKDKGRGTSN